MAVTSNQASQIGKEDYYYSNFYPQLQHVTNEESQTPPLLREPTHLHPCSSHGLLLQDKTRVPKKSGGENHTISTLWSALINSCFS
eukprot:SM000009S23482  [mRNA]  locus=s9:272480:275711:+ [translate_table: standard]